MAAAAALSSSRARMLPWAWLGVGAAAGAVFLLTGSDAVKSGVYASVGASSLVLALVGLRRTRGRVPLGWKLVVAGAATWFAGDLLWTAIALRGGVPAFPSAVDAVYMSAYPPMFAGVVVAWRARMIRPLAGLLDTGIVAVAGGLAVWAVVGGKGQGAAAVATAVAYPTCDIAMLAAIAQLLAVRPLHVRSLQALAGAFACFLVGDVAYASSALGTGYAAGGWISTTWFSAYVLLGFAGLHPGVASLGGEPLHRVRMSTRRLLVLLASCLLVPAAGALQTVRDELEPFAYVGAGALLIVLVFARMALLFREQQQTAQELRESGELYRALVEQSGDMVALLGADDRLVYASAAHEETLGYTPQAMLELRAADLVHPDDFERSRRALAHVAAGDGGDGTLIRLRRKDGSWIWVDIRGSAIRDRDGTPLILLTSRDVTRRQRAEQELARTTQKLQTLIDTAPVAIIACDVEGRVTLWNPHAETLFGWRADEVLGAPTPLLTAEALHGTMTLLRAGEVVEGEGPRPHKDGSTVDVYRSAAPFRSESGEVAGIFAIFVDVSERNRLEERLRQSQRLEAIGQLAGGIAHDFNNLLTAISGYRELALLRAGGDETLRHHLAGIGDAADRAAGLTRQLLAFSRRQLLQPTVFDLNDAVERTQSLLRRVLGGHIDVVTALDPAGCPVRADHGQLEQVLMNLAVNARDAMPDGGSLRIETVREAERHVRLRVTDTGCGMDEETLRHAFEPFFTTKGLGEGTGLGLSTVYGIVTQSGGAVEVHSEPGRGATFEVVLPLTDEAPAASAPRPAEPAAGSERVLLVEDEPVVRELTREMLECHGYDVVCAGRPDDALELARTEPVDLLVTDVVMPGMNGRALARALRAERPDLRVLYTSGYSDDAALQGGSLEPLASFLQKPYSSRELAAAVRRTLDAAA